MPPLQYHPQDAEIGDSGVFRRTDPNFIVNGADVQEHTTARRGIYGCFKLETDSADRLYHWCIQYLIPNPQPVEKLHSTFIFSPAPAKSKYIPYSFFPITLDPNTYSFQIFPYNVIDNALVLTYRNPIVESEHKKYLLLGGSYTHPQFVPHITLSSNVPINVLVKQTIPLPKFPIRFSGIELKPIDK